MKHKKIEVHYMKDIYTCERCGAEYEFVNAAVTCPKHGEFCYKCHNEKESMFPLEICPECKITYQEAIKTTPSLVGLTEIQLPDHFIVILRDSRGIWIGSKK